MLQLPSVSLQVPVLGPLPPTGMKPSVQLSSEVHGDKPGACGTRQCVCVHLCVCVCVGWMINIIGVNGQNSEEMCHGGKPGTGKLYTDVAPPTPVGAWSMALGLRQRFEYYYYYCSA